MLLNKLEQIKRRREYFCIWQFSQTIFTMLSIEVQVFQLPPVLKMELISFGPLLHQASSVLD